MTRDELLQRINRRAKLRYGFQVTWRALRDWVDEELMPGPTPRGRRRGKGVYWDWPWSSCVRALQICCLKSRGVNTFASIRLHLWFGGIEMPIWRVRKSLEEEMRRFRKRAFRSVSSTYDPRMKTGVSKREAHTVAKQLGELSPAFAASGVRYAAEDLVITYGATRFGEPQNRRADGTKAPFRDVVPRAMRQLGIPTHRQEAVLQAEMSFSGLLGDPGEIEGSAEDTISRASKSALLQARLKIRHRARLLRRISEVEANDGSSVTPESRELVRQVAKQIRLGPWRIIVFVLLLQDLHRGGTSMADKIPPDQLA